MELLTDFGVLELTKEQNEDIALFKRTCGPIQLSFFSKAKKTFLVVDSACYVGISNSLAQLKREYKPAPQSSIAKDIMGKIRPFMGRVVCVQKDINGPFVFQLRSGLLLAVAPFLDGVIKGD